jgi:hypothetical protein
VARVPKVALIAFFAVQAIVAGLAYRTALADKYAQPFGWQMFTGNTKRPRFTLIRPTGEEDFPLTQVLYSYRNELNDELSFDHRVFDFVCARHEDVTAIRVTVGLRSRTVPCNG